MTTMYSLALLDHIIGIRGIKMLDNRVVPWFPRDVGELDLVANKTLEAGVDIESDHPGFLDQGRVSSPLTLPNITSPYLTSHHLTSPPLTLPHNTSLHLTYHITSSLHLNPEKLVYSDSTRSLLEKSYPELSEWTFRLINVSNTCPWTQSTGSEEPSLRVLRQDSDIWINCHSYPTLKKKIKHGDLFTTVYNMLRAYMHVLNICPSCL